MTSSTDMVLAYMFAKNRYIKLKFGMLDLQAWLYNICTLFYFFANFGFCKKLYKNFSIFTSWVKFIFAKIRDSHFEEVLIIRLSLIFICIMLQFSVFGDLPTIYQFSTKNDIGSLK